MNKIKNIKHQINKKTLSKKSLLVMIASLICNFSYSNNYDSNQKEIETKNTSSFYQKQGIQLNKIIAIVNTQIITQQELDEKTYETRKMLEQQGIQVPGHIVLEKQVLKQMITEELKLQLANKNGLTATKKEIDQAFKQIAIQNNVTTEKLRPIISKQYGSFEKYQENLKKQVTINKLQQQIVASHNINITENDIQKFIKKQKQKSKDNIQYKLEHILIPIPNNPSPEAIRKTREKAEDILNKIKQGQDFKQAAVTYSASDDALKGGIMPWKTIDDLPEAFQKVS